MLITACQPPCLQNHAFLIMAGDLEVFCDRLFCFLEMAEQQEESQHAINRICVGESGEQYFNV